MTVTVARVYWPMDAKLAPIALPRHLWSGSQAVAVKILDIPLSATDLNEVLEATWNVESWLERHGLSLLHLSGVIIDDHNSHNDDHQQSQRVAAGLTDKLRLLATILVSQLTQAPQHQQFITQLAAVNEFITLTAERLTAGRLLDFHTRYKMLFLAHSQPAYRELGPYVAGVKQAASLRAFAQQYRQKFMQLLRQPATVPDHTNALMHMQGYFRGQLADAERKALTDAIHQFRLQQQELDSVIKLFHQALAQHPHPWLLAQRYLYPWLAEQPLTSCSIL